WPADACMARRPDRARGAGWPAVVVFWGLRMRIGRMSAHRACGAGCHRPWRPGPAGGHLGVVRPVRRDAPAIRKQDAGVLEHHDAVAEQAPTLFGMRRHDAGPLAIRCVRGRTGKLMLAHDAPLSYGRVLRQAAGPAAALPAAPAGWCPRADPLRADLAARGPEHRRTRAAGERSMSPFLLMGCGII